MAGGLVVVGTPIGNLEDMSPRAIRALEEADFIAAEDTRVSRKLMTHFDIRTPMVSYHQHNQLQSGPVLLDRMSAGEVCAIITDAGMPCISDPGQDLVRLCHDRGLPVWVVPGPTAALSALAASGLPTDRFAFEGFLAIKKSRRAQHLEEIREDPRTLIFYEAPHKLRATLDDLTAALGADRPISLCRELTKLHEEIWRTTLGEAREKYRTQDPRGEFVLVVGGAPPREAPPPVSLEEAALLVVQLAGCGVSLSQAAKTVAEDTGYRKGELYRLALTQAPGYGPEEFENAEKQEETP